ncbi:MAG: helix-turn-helix transcriptional regulator [Gemmatimonadaceae bacterium]|nr:helix-turn-helix transcriptional regulator [Gemmatimonadaceae bacterium]
MNPAKAKRLESRGWKIGTAADFLGLTEAEAALVEIKLSLSDAVRKARKRRGITQVALAKSLNSSQSRIAKLEAGGPGVSLDLLVRAALVTGTTRSEVAAALSREIA